MGTELFDLLGTDSDDPRVQAAMEDARDAERLVDSLVAMRVSQGITQVDVAERMDTTQSAVSKFERAGGDPRLSTLQRYARAVGGRLHCLASTSPGSRDIWRETSYRIAAFVETDATNTEDEVTIRSFKLVS
jgi:transcriptional regulator with XRE-family HTH domain